MSDAPEETREFKALIDRLWEEIPSQYARTVEHSLKHLMRERDEAVRMSEWQDISTAPSVDETHIRGLWVFHRPTGTRYWQQYIGHIDEETGDFIDEDRNDFGWGPTDYEKWMPLPSPPHG